MSAKRFYFTAFFILFFCAGSVFAQTGPEMTSEELEELEKISTNDPELEKKFEEIVEQHKKAQMLSVKRKEQILKKNLFRAARGELLRRALTSEEFKEIYSLKTGDLKFMRQKDSKKYHIYYVQLKDGFLKLSYISDPRRFEQDPVRTLFYTGKIEEEEHLDGD